MFTKQFSLLYGKLNAEQKKAVDTIEGPVMVIAGPGTGKTQILILRIAKILLETQSEPENILALTFTESAVYEMRKRLVDLIGTAGYRVEIDTFHGFCNKVIQHRRSEFEDLIEADSIDELDQITIIESIIEKGNFKYIKPFGAPLHYVKPVLQAISELKKEGVDIHGFKKSILKQEANFQSIEDLYHVSGVHKGLMKSKYVTLQKKIKKNYELLELYKEYEEALKKMKKYDYNDMLLRVLTELKKNKDLLLELQEIYQYFLIDEHQDTNKAQNIIIEYLCNYYSNPNLFVVGDEKQAIFRFQGATLENFLYFKNLYKDAVLINLKENYRSSQMILDAAGSLIDHNVKTDVLIKDNSLRSRSKHKDIHIHIAKLSSFFAEYYFVGQEIQKKIQEGVNPQEIAVLARNNKDIDPFIAVFEQLSVPYVIESDQNIFQDIVVEKLLVLFYAIYRLGSDTELIQAMHIDIFNIDPIDIYKLIEFAKIKKTFLWDVLSANTYHTQVKLQSLDNIVQFVQQIKEWKTQSMNDSFDNVFINVLNTGFLKKVLQNKNNIDVIEKISSLYTQIKILVSRNHLFNLDDFITHIELLKKHHISPFASVKSPYRQGVHLMTAHKAKGREFDYVFIINAYDGHWGNKREMGNLFLIPWEYLSVAFDTIPETQGNEDDRRLFFVALTRARKQVFISYATSAIDQKEQIISQFIEEVDSLFRKDIEVSQFEKYFAIHPEILLQKIPFKKEEKFLSHKQFFNELFIRRGLSVSGLNNYLECPWKYFFRNLIMLPDVKNKSMIFGSCVHESLNAFLTSKEKGKKRIQFAVEQYQKALNRQPLSEKELIELRGRESTVKDYLSTRALEWKKENLSELNIKGIRFTEHIFLNGKIDMIEQLNHEGDVAVFDFKTGKPKSRSFIEGSIKSSPGDYKRQLVFYKILLDTYKEGKLKMNVKEGVIEFVEKNERGMYQTERFIITKEEVEELKKLIVKVGQEILDLSFILTTCDNRACEYCRLRSFMG